MFIIEIISSVLFFLLIWDQIRKEHIVRFNHNQILGYDEEDCWE
jgi:hypothetical protein